MRLTALDLFSCVGCQALGFERAGIKTTEMCEVVPWRIEQLRRNWPRVQVHEDIKTLRPKQADITVGGPPCQGTSRIALVHGYRDGSSLWNQMFRCGIEARSEWFVVEQPPAIDGWEAKVIDDLSRIGKHVAVAEFGAHDVGAPYIRRRRFVIACSSRKRLEVAWRAIPSEIAKVKRAANARGDWDPSAIPAFGVDTWRSEVPRVRQRRIEALGDSNPPHMAEAIGRAIVRASQ